MTASKICCWRRLLKRTDMVVVLFTASHCPVQAAGAGGAVVLREIRYLDKLVDELAKGKPLEKVLRK